MIKIRFHRMAYLWAFMAVVVGCETNTFSATPGSQRIALSPDLSRCVYPRRKPPHASLYTMSNSGERRITNSRGTDLNPWILINSNSIAFERHTGKLHEVIIADLATGTERQIAKHSDDCRIMDVDASGKRLIISTANLVGNALRGSVAKLYRTDGSRAPMDVGSHATFTLNGTAVIWSDETDSDSGISLLDVASGSTSRLCNGDTAIPSPGLNLIAVIDYSSGDWRVHEVLDGVVGKQLAEVPRGALFQFISDSALVFGTRRHAYLMSFDSDREPLTKVLFRGSKTDDLRGIMRVGKKCGLYIHRHSSHRVSSRVLVFDENGVGFDVLGRAVLYLPD